MTVFAPPANRVGKADGEHEHHLYEGAVMIAYAMHLLRTEGTRDVRVHRDGKRDDKRRHGRVEAPREKRLDARGSA